MMNGQTSSQENKSEDPVSSLRQDRKVPPDKDMFVLFFGIVAPAAALILGWIMRSSPCFFLFDPIPTCRHLFIYSLIPICNLCCRFSRSENRDYLPILGFLNGAAIGASFFCTLMLFPFFMLLIVGAVVLCIRWEWMIFAVLSGWFSMVLLFFGILWTIPLLAFISANRCRHHLKRRIPETGRGKIPGTWTGIILTVTLLIMLEIPLNLTLWGIRLASSERTETHIRLLRMFGDEETILKMCYGKIRLTPLGFFSSMTAKYPSDISALYYRVTGKSFNETGPYGDPRFRPRNTDVCLGTDSVGGKQKGLSLSLSRMEGVIHSDVAHSYLEWTLEFENTSDSEQEARAQIQLFQGSTVSRVTMWIDGEEREALFAEKEKVLKAYRQSVSRKQDAVLVSDKGNGRIMVQCFPVPGRGKMKIRLGITSPLFLEKEDQGRLNIPCFPETNFDIGENFRHSVRIESKHPLSAENRQFKTAHSEQGLYVIQGTAGKTDLSETAIVIQAARSPAAVMCWSRDPVGSGAIWQMIGTAERTCPSRIIFVIDGSRGMREFMPEIADALSYLPQGIEFGLTVASDTADSVLLLSAGTPETYRAAGERLKKTDCIGGQDNISVLIQAWDIAAEKKNSAVVRIHRGQPVLLQSPEILKQKIENCPEIRLFDIQAANGADRILEAFDLKGNIEVISVFGNMSRDLKRLFSEWKGTQKYYGLSRSRIGTGFGLSRDRETSSHLARLWAYNEVLKLCAADVHEQKEQTVQFAADYHIVTPVTGAAAIKSDSPYRMALLELFDIRSAEMKF